jgi:hypothetical protein
MPSVFTIQGPDLPPGSRSALKVRADGAEPFVRLGKREMDVLCDVRQELWDRSVRARNPSRSQALRIAADSIQFTFEDYKGGKEYFFSGRCGTKRRR